MPLILHKNIEEKSSLWVWKDAETLNFFIARTKLSEQERELLNKYTNERRKKDLLISRYLLQQQIPNANINYHKSGKPYISNHDVQISISHSKDIVCIILHPHKTIGIDIEYISSRIERLASRFLNHDELTIAKTNQLKTLYWSAKETLFKIDSIQGLDFRKELHLSPIEEGKLLGSIRKEKEIIINYTYVEDWVLTYALA